jgi:photosystem II stability/assembly factor-like uncharacterized protein
MKNFILLILTCLAFGNSYAQNYWIQHGTPASRDLREIYFLDSLKGWAAGDQGTMIKTTNGGTNWTAQNTGIESDIYDLFFINENTGWAITWDIEFPDYYTIILKTTNGGTNWTANQYPASDNFFNAVYFLNPNTGFLGGVAPDHLVRTTNGGINWTRMNIDSNIVSGFPIISFKFFSDTYGFASGGHIDIAGVMWKTTDGGLNWKTEGVGPEPVQSIFIFDSLNVISAGGDYEYGTGVVTTTNGGTNWEYRSLEIFGIASAISFRTREEGWSPLGNAQKLIYTKDSSRTWQEWATPNSLAIYDLQFTDRRNGFACGENGTIFKYNKDLININNNFEIIPSDFKLFQNFPNPFNPSTKISYRISYASNISINVYDAKGSFIKKIEEGFKPSGSYEINFEGKDLPSGVYIYKLDVSSGLKNFSESRKMVLVK